MKIINSEMDAVVGELKEDSSDVTERSVLGMVVEEVQENVRDTVPLFYDLVRAAAWSEEQDERNTLKDPTKVCVLRESGPQQLTFSVSRLSSARSRSLGTISLTRCTVPSRFT